MDASSAAPAPVTALSVSQRNWMLALLALTGACSTTDRAIISIALEPIKAEFQVSDSQLGLVAGLAFAIAHAVVAVPAGALADRISRRWVIAGALVVWSAMTGLCGLAHSFLQLFLARMGVGAGEAGGQAATLSSVSDLFPPERRATAISIFYLAAPLGTMLAAGGGGVIAAAYGWRAAMAAAAAPGFLLALVLLFCREIPREASPGGGTEATPSFGQALRFIIAQRSLLHVLAAVTLISLLMTGQGAFGYSFFIRYHHMNLRELGPIIGLTTGILGGAMMLSSGLMADWLGKRDPRLRLWVVVAVLAAISPLVMLGYLLPQPYALPFYLTHVLLNAVWLGPAYATAQNLAHPRTRSTVASIMYVIAGFIGFGLGPVMVGGMSDLLTASIGAQGLRVSLLITTALGLWAAVHFILAGRTLRDDLARAHAAVV